MSIKEDIKGLRAKQYKVIVATLWKVACTVRPRVTQFLVSGKKTCILRLIKPQKICIPQLELQYVQ